MNVQNFMIFGTYKYYAYYIKQQMRPY